MERHPDQVFCGECGKLISRAAEYCTGCGARQVRAAVMPQRATGLREATTETPLPGRVADEKYCLRCGRVVHESAPTCPGCGAAQPGHGGGGTNASRNRTTAAILALFLGGVGVHRFYIGRPGSGILYLLFFWTFIPAVVALVEGVIWLTMDDTKWQAQYGRTSGF
jgi:TM2 domain-containing membrane protein YozV/RNA polymerase subunit RPABC4/transcription elongation factor Spt4